MKPIQNYEKFLPTVIFENFARRTAKETRCRRLLRNTLACLRNRFPGAGCRVQGSGFRVQGSGFRAWRHGLGANKANKVAMILLLLGFGLMVYANPKAHTQYHPSPPNNCVHTLERTRGRRDGLDG